jgi:hypothetical protein
MSYYRAIESQDTSSFRRQPNASDTIVVRIQATLEDARLENLRQGAPRIHDELLKFGG